MVIIHYKVKYLLLLTVEVYSEVVCVSDQTTRSVQPSFFLCKLEERMWAESTGSVGLGAFAPPALEGGRCGRLALDRGCRFTPVALLLLVSLHVFHGGYSCV